MENGYIQLPYGYVKKDDEKLYFDLPLDYKKNCYLISYLMSHN